MSDFGSVAMTSCVVACGRQQNTASRPDQSASSILTRVGALEPGQMREHLGQALAGLALAGEQRDVDLRVAGQQAQELGAGIAAGPQNADLQPILRLGHVTLSRRRPTAAAPNFASLTTFACP